MSINYGADEKSDGTDGVAARSGTAVDVVSQPLASAFRQNDEQFQTVYQQAPRAGHDVVVGVVDQGIHRNDEWLGGKVIQRVGPKANNTFDEGEASHGTQVGGIAAVGDPAIRLLDVRVRDQVTGFAPVPVADEVANMVQGIEKALESDPPPNIFVIALAGGVGPNTADTPELYMDQLRPLIARNPNVLFVVGAGNSDWNADKGEVYPAALNDGSLDNLLVVGGAGKDGSVVVDDSRGLKTKYGYGERTVDIAGFGGPLSVYDPGNWTTFSTQDETSDAILAPETGVSFAIPQVANVAAKMFSSARRSPPPRSSA